jgi:hypothetical protein
MSKRFGQFATLWRIKTMKIPLVLAGLLLLATSERSFGGVIFTKTPVNSWRYYEGPAGHGLSQTYYPTSVAEFSSAPFKGYVTYDPTAFKPGDGPAPHYFYGPSGDDTFQIFTTYVDSSIDQTLSIRIDGDDGHSLFVNDAFVIGGPFAAVLDTTLTFQANVPVKLTLAGHNGPGPWAFGIGLPLGANNISGPINDVAFLKLNANGNFAATPEPATAVLFGMGCLCVLAVRRRSGVTQPPV